MDLDGIEQPQIDRAAREPRSSFHHQNMDDLARTTDAH